MGLHYPCMTRRTVALLLGDKPADFEIQGERSGANVPYSNPILHQLRCVLFSPFHYYFCDSTLVASM